MTLMAEPPAWPDRLLAKCGKKRAVFIPEGMQPYGYYVARREGFLSALLRPKGRSPTKGWVYWEMDDVKVAAKTVEP